MSVIKCNYADDADSNKQQWETVNSVTDQIHKSQSRLRSVQTLTEAAAFVMSVKQADEQCNDDDDQNNIICWVRWELDE